MSSFFDLFRKDPNGTYSHNLGVGMLRTGALCIIIALIALPFRFLNLGNTITFKDKADVIIVDVSSQKHTHYRHRRRGGSRRVTYYTYKVQFTGTYKDGSTFEGSQKSSYDLNRTFQVFADGSPHEMSVYTSDEKGTLFVSALEHEGAQKQYQSVYKSLSMYLGELVFKYVGLLGIVLISSGLKHQRRGRKESFSAAADANAAANQKLNDAAKIFDKKY